MPRVIESAGRVMPRCEAAPLGAHVATRDRVIVVAADPQHLVVVDRHDDPARRRADPAVRKLLAFHDRTLRRDQKIVVPAR